VKNIFSFINKNIFNLITVTIVTAYSLCLIITSYLIYLLSLLTGIETLFRVIIIIILILLLFIFLFIGFNIIKRKKIILFLIYVLTIILFIIIEAVIAYNINKMYNAINTISQKEVIYTTSLITLADSNIKTINDIKNIEIGIINDEDSIDGYIISQEIIEENKLAKNNTYNKYDSFILMISDLYEKKVDAIFVPGNYASMFSDDELFQNLKNDTNIIITKEKRIKEQEKYQNTKITKPFTLLIMGIDDKSENINVNANGDALMLITFNPKTLNATILSIPRDTLVPITCRNNYQTKITHASWYGEKCMMATIEKLIDINIDYYVKVNFKGVVKLVDVLGGIEVDVPMKFCEQNSNREKGNKEICLDKGWQRLNGEEALALSRNRYDAPGGDIGRGLNQQLVLKTILNEAKNINNINQFYDILEVIENNIATNFSTNQILSLYNIGKDIIKHSKSNNEPLAFQQLFLKTYGLYIYDPSSYSELSMQAYYKGSLNDVIKAMKINLDLFDQEPIKTFAYSIKEPYEKKKIGEGPYYGESKIQLVPDFTSKDKEYALNWCLQHDIKITFETIQSDDPNYTNNQIIKQNMHSKSLLSRINKNEGIILTIVEKVETTNPNKVNCTLTENEENPVCFMPKFINEKISNVDDWLNSIVYNFIVTKEKVMTSNEEEHLIIFEQSVNEGIKIKDMSAELIIKYYFYENNEEETEEELEDETEINP